MNGLFHQGKISFTYIECFGQALNREYESMKYFYFKISIKRMQALCKFICESIAMI